MSQFIHVKHKKVNIDKALQSSLLKETTTYLKSSTVSKLKRGKFRANAPATRAYKKSSKPLHCDNNLRGSITQRVESVSKDGETKLVGIIGTNHPGAFSNNFGATIKAKIARRLLIPGSRTRELQRTYGYNTRTLIRRMKKNGYKVWWRPGATMAKHKDEEDAFILFYRKKKVKIPKREFLYISKSDRNGIRKIERRFLDKCLS